DWVSAASDLLPGTSFGDYSLQIRGRGEQMDVSVSTLRPGRVTLSGSGRLVKGRRPVFNGTISGDPALLQRLPNIAGQLVRPTGDPGRLLISVN
ncbi:MAG: hypothetical protein HGA47_03550, partial [Zoogloea sp.]|nr:hypothetical protein [Zoogloea sp.]